LDSLDWSHKYEVHSISRLDLQSCGMTTQQINQLTDEDMDRIAEELAHRYHLNGFNENAVFVAQLILAEKEGGEHEA